MWRKMTRKGVSLREVFDARALRVVVDDQNGAKLQQARSRAHPFAVHLHVMAPGPPPLAAQAPGSR